MTASLKHLLHVYRIYMTDCLGLTNKLIQSSCLFILFRNVECLGLLLHSGTDYTAVDRLGRYVHAFWFLLFQIIHVSLIL